MGGDLSVTLGVPQHLSIAESVSYCLYNPFRALLPHQPKGLGDVEKLCSDVTFFLVLTKEGVAGDRVYGHSMIWVNPYQAKVSTMEEAVKQLTALVSTRPDFPYTLVQLNGNAHHMPLPREGHLSILVEGGTSSANCRRVSQLEVCQLLSSDLQVIYQVGLKGCEVPVIASLPESLAKGANLFGGKPIYLKVDILQSIVEGPKLKVPPPGGHSSSILIASPIRGSSAKGKRRGHHDHRGEGAPIPGRIRHIWTCIREFQPKEARAHGSQSHLCPPNWKIFPGPVDIIPGEHPG